ncbi:MAG: hypothetical protein QOG75_5822 [Mycobacterium sp.]|jgi:hypothetical protein|nr:hypothetical protein [Mycobacterium sp.]
MSYNVKTIAAGALLSAGVAMAGLVLGAGTAYADPGFIEPVGPYQWCPGGRPSTLDWDHSICHKFWIVARGHGNVDGTTVVSDGAPLDNVWEGPNPPRVPEGPCFAMWLPAPCPNG